MEEERDDAILRGLIRFYLGLDQGMSYGGVAQVLGCTLQEVQDVAREERKRRARAVARARGVPSDPWSIRRE